MPFKPSDHLEREGTKDPFEVEMDDGRVFVARDPRRMHFKTLASIGQDPVETIRAIFDDHADEVLDAAEVTVGWITEMTRAWNEHYGLATPGEQRASST